MKLLPISYGLDSAACVHTLVFFLNLLLQAIYAKYQPLAYTYELVTYEESKHHRDVNFSLHLLTRPILNSSCLNLRRGTTLRKTLDRWSLPFRQINSQFLHEWFNKLSILFSAQGTFVTHRDILGRMPTHLERQTALGKFVTFVRSAAVRFEGRWPFACWLGDINHLIHIDGTNGFKRWTGTYGAAYARRNHR